MKQHAKKCASHQHKYNGDARNRFPDVMKDCDCDGYHSFDELYDHRVTLFIALCRIGAKIGRANIWRSKLHSDGSSFAGWFVLGIHKGIGKQITYHLPLSKWEETGFAETLEKAPEFDGHTPDDVLERLSTL